MKIHLDLESYSEADIKKVGAYRYAEDPSTEILMVGYAIGDEPEGIWFPRRELMPWGLAVALADEANTVHAFNAAFERVMFKHVLPDVHALIAPERWRCTAIEAYALSFAGGLDSVAAQIGLPVSKDPRGRKLIERFSKRQPKGRKVPRWDEHNDPEGFAEFAAYCMQDVRVEREVSRWVASRYNLSPLELYHTLQLDAAIESRGVAIDLGLVDAARALRDVEYDRIDQALTLLTGLANPNSPSQLLEWLHRTGTHLDDLQAENIDALLRGGCTIDPHARRVLELRRQRSLSSVSKLDALARATGADGRLRGTLQTRGASRTGRYAGRIFQPQNLPRGAGEKADELIEVVKQGDRDEVMRVSGTGVIESLSSVIRGCVVPSSVDKLLVTCDYSSIESRVLGWLSGCTRVIETFATGRDTYKDFAMIIFGVPYDEVTKKQRSYAKPPVLGCGYRLGGKGLVAYAHGMGVTMLESDATIMVSKYREAYPEIPKFWYWIEGATMEAMTGKVVTGYRMQVWVEAGFLWLQLPSGRRLSYYRPEVRDMMMPWGTSKPCLSYMGQDSRTRQWRRIQAHGGILTENIIQAIAYDVLVVGLNRCAQRGLDIVMHVHDEIVVEADAANAEATLALMRDEMSRSPLWAPDLLLDAAGFTTYHYRKD